MENMAAENAEVLFKNLERFLKTETVVGEPIVVGETTLIPLISVSFGCGTGGGNGVDGKGNNGGGAGLGGAVRITPNSILVIRDGDVKLIPTQGKSNLSSLVDMVPEIVSKLNLDLGKRKEKRQSKEESAESEKN